MYNVIRLQFYEKPMTSKMIINKSSAIGWPVKRATLMAEVYRRLYNTDSLTTWQEKAHMINCLVVKMWRSGYNNQDVVCFVQGGVRKFEKMITLHIQAEDVRPLYRDKKFRSQER